jgi:hypothetical protein
MIFRATTRGHEVVISKSSHDYGKTAKIYQIARSQTRKVDELGKALILIIPIIIGGTLSIAPAFGQPALIQDSAPQGNTYSPARPGKPTSPDNLRNWFQAYDDIRRRAQMSPSEKQKADGMMSQGLSVVIPGAQKAETQQLLSSLVNRYQVAAGKLKNLPFYPETGDLHKGYFQYFTQAGGLFSDYLKVQGNLFAVDGQTGKPLASELMTRKEALESLDQRNKYIDTQVRNQLGIAPYQY